MTKQDHTGRREVFTCRLRPSLQLALKDAAHTDRRTISNEIEHLLGIALGERRFERHALLGLIGEAIESLPRPQRYSRAAQLAVVEAAFDLEDADARRRKPSKPRSDDALAGRMAFTLTWDEMRRLDARDRNLKPRQLYLLALREALGSLPDRAMVLGIDGREVKRQAAALTRAEFDELRRLSLEAFPIGKPDEEPPNPRPLSPAKRRRYLELYAKLPTRSPRT